MVLYFSGTGNSAYVAKKIAKAIQDETVSMNDKIKSRDYAKLDSVSPWVFVVPTYAWRIPRVVQEWISRADFHGNRRAYFIMTCGGDIGNAGKYAKELCEKKGFRYMGCLEIVMPENYVAMFPVPEREAAEKIVAKAEPEIAAAGEMIREGKAFPERKISFGNKVSSGMVNDVFYPLFVHAKKFYSTSGCIGCGHCVKVCPLNNVTLVDGRPKWGDCCTHCMACICECPKEAIEYGNKSKGKPRYRCPGQVE
ncbi:MAG: EFR1 family ferrodoxin [Eubacteriales bacterium]|nr:EFR1 family ferrodoxin [Eubacteriales bacterium]